MCELGCNLVILFFSGKWGFEIAKHCYTQAIINYTQYVKKYIIEPKEAVDLRLYYLFLKLDIQDL